LIFPCLSCALAQKRKEKGKEKKKRKGADVDVSRVFLRLDKSHKEKGKKK
jgi:hypothetical protein